MANLSSHQKPCTEFCDKLRALKRVDGRLPGYADLVSQLGGPKDQQCSWVLGTWEELRLRDSCSVCRLVVSTLLESRRAPGGLIDPGQEIRSLLFPGEQSFRLSYPSFVEARLAFVAEDDHDASGPDNARAVTRSRIQPALVQKWMRTCHEKHRLTCGEQRQAGPGIDSGREQAVFRLIDTKLGCVRKMPLQTAYVTLSYVWGQLPMFKLNKGNVDMLMTHGSLEAVREDLPKTINDAIDFIKACGLRYLWVDALCLVQDEPQDISLGISLMSSIYHDSLFTLVAGSGADANAGLPGVQPNSRTSSQTIVDIAPGLRMTATHSIDWHLSQSVYNRRGWTCQELVLPRRAVIFLNNTVYFRCQSANWSEETASDCPTVGGDVWLDPDDFNIPRVPTLLEGEEPAWWAYQKLSEDYSRRELRFDSDALRAVAGIARPLAECMDTCMLQGLPLRYLDNALLFMSSTGTMRRRPGFASYSWAGWEGKVMWPRENYDWGTKRKRTEAEAGERDDADDEEKVPDLSGWMDAHTMVAWAAKLPDGKVQALFPFGRFRRSVSSLKALMLTLPGIFSEGEPQKLENVGLGAMHYLTGGTAHYNSIFNFEERPTERFLFTKEMDKLAATSPYFSALMAEGRGDDAARNDVSRGGIQKWMGNWLAQSRFWERRSKRFAKTEKQTRNFEEEQTQEFVHAKEMGTLANDDPTSNTLVENRRNRQVVDGHMQLMLLEEQNRKRLMAAQGERRVARAQTSGNLEDLSSTEPMSSTSMMPGASGPMTAKTKPREQASSLQEYQMTLMRLIRKRKDQRMAKRIDLSSGGALDHREPNIKDRSTGHAAQLPGGVAPVSNDTTWSTENWQQPQQAASSAFRTRRDERIAKMGVGENEETSSSSLQQSSPIASHGFTGGTGFNANVPVNQKGLGSSVTEDEAAARSSRTPGDEHNMATSSAILSNEAVSDHFRERKRQRTGQPGRLDFLPGGLAEPSDSLERTARDGYDLIHHNFHASSIMRKRKQQILVEGETLKVHERGLQNGRPMSEGTKEGSGNGDQMINTISHGRDSNGPAPSSLQIGQHARGEAERTGEPEPDTIELWSARPQLSPPYPLLCFQTISLRLILGQSVRPSIGEAPTHSIKLDQNQSLTSAGQPATSQPNPWLTPNQNNRRPGTPLLSHTGRLVGSLHPDTCEAQPGTEVECLVVARAPKPTFGSALQEEEVCSRDLLWVLHVVPSEREGIVERRGVGQILVEALAGAKPEVKMVSLG